MGINSGTPMTK